MTKYLMILVCFFPVTALAQSSDEFLAALIEAYDNKTPLAMSYAQGISEASQTQNQFIEHLSKTMGSVVGYKAALTNPGARKKFGTTEPILGTLLEKMVLENGAKVPVKFGVHSLLEGDMMMRVGSEEINNARTPEETLACIDAIIPFMELPDIIFKPGTQLNAETLAASNAGARLGVKGKPIPFSASAENLKALEKIRLEITNSKGDVVGFGYANALLNNPINAVIWLRDNQLKAGKKLKKGDLLSLGSITRMLPVTQPETFTLAYYGIPGVDKAEVSVTFE